MSRFRIAVSVAVEVAVGVAVKAAVKFEIIFLLRCGLDLRLRLRLRLVAVAVAVEIFYCIPGSGLNQRFPFKYLQILEAFSPLRVQTQAKTGTSH